MISPSKKEKLKLKKINSIAYCIIAQSLVSILWLLLIPKEPGNALILGYSLRRLMLSMAILLPLFGALLLQMGLKKYARWQAWLIDDKKKPKTALLLAGGGFLLAVTVWSFTFFFHFLRFFPDLGAYIRLLPLVSNYFLLGVEAILFVPLIIYPCAHEKNSEKRDFSPRAFLAALGILIAGLILVETTGWGKDPVRVSIISLGAPLLEGQIWYITGMLALLMAAAFAWACIPKESRPALRWKADLIIMLVLWLIAVTLWMSLPLPKNNYFAPSVQAPNFEKYPFSDAEQYDLNSLFVYYGSLKGFVVSKPLYVSLLALLHTLVGLDYNRIILLQTLLVAFFPAVLYMAGKELHSRLGGIAIALFAILREVTGIQGSNIANVSSTKLLLSDMPAALLASVLALVLIRWFKAGGKRMSWHEFIIGGLLGAFILTRIQTMALVPFVLVLIVIRNFRRLKSVLLSSAILLLAIGLVITPVLLRNHAITGVYWVDNPASSKALSNFLTKGIDVEEEVKLNLPQDEAIVQNKDVIGSLLINNFGDVANFVMDNFMRNELSSYLVLPIRLGNQQTLLDFLTVNIPFWEEVYSQKNLQNLLVFLANATLIALGFAAIFHRNPWAVVAVLGLHIVYSLSSAMVRLSGWRFIMPMDWTLYALYALGLVELLMWVFKKSAGWNLASHVPWLTDYPPDEQTKQHGWSSYILFGALFVFIGAAIPLRENLLPAITQEYTKPDICQTIEAQIVESEYAQLAEDFSKFCLADNTQVLKGYGIYPRYFKSDEGFYDRSYDPWFGKQPYARLVFRLIGTSNGKVYIKSENEAPRFPNGAVVYVVGVKKAKFEAQVVLVEGQEPELLISSEIISGQESFSILEK